MYLENFSVVLTLSWKPYFYLHLFLIFALNKHNATLFNSFGFFNTFVDLDFINLFALR